MVLRNFARADAPYRVCLSPAPERWLWGARFLRNCTPARVARITEDLRRLAVYSMATLAELRREYGRENEPFEVHVISMDAFTVDGIKRLEDLGVTDAIVGFRNAYEADTTTLDQKVGALRSFADNVIAKV